MKCDEQRNPNCARCERGGYVCEWQDTQRSRSRFSDERLSLRTARSRSQTTIQSDDESNLSHRFFSESIVVGVAGLFTDMAESFLGNSARAADVSGRISKFYYQFVFQAGRSSPIVHKTLTALCGLYERTFASSVSSSPRNPEYIAYYSEAVTDLRYMSRELPPDIVLIISILFANCEYLIGGLCSAIQHLQAGARILNEHTIISDGRLSPDLCDTLRTIFEAFNHDSIRSDSLSSEQHVFDVFGGTQFEDLDQANDSLLLLYSHTFALRRVSSKHPRHITPAIHDFQLWSSSWMNRTSKLEQTLAYDDRPWLHLLHGQHQALDTVIDHMPSSNDGFPQENHQFDDLILCMSSFIDMCPQFASLKPTSERPFLDNIGLILPLFVVTLLCPDLQTCQTALLLLRRLKVQEGVWNSCCAYAVAHFIVNARHKAQLNSGNTTDPFIDALPIATISKVLPLTNDELEVSVRFPQAAVSLLQNETSTTIVGSFCACPTEDFERLSSVMKAGGYQGLVSTQLLDGCSCWGPE